MSLACRVIFYLGYVLLLAGCLSPESDTPFSFSHHDLKIQYDPLSHELNSIDTLTIQYHKNVDRIYFFLQKSLFIESVGVGHQAFNLDEMSDDEIVHICENLDESWRQIAANSQIVTVRIPKSLYSERIQIRYRGFVDLSQDSTIIWYPALPNMSSTFHVTALIPCDYKIVSSEKIEETVDGTWRLNQWHNSTGQANCFIRVMPTIDDKG